MFMKVTEKIAKDVWRCVLNHTKKGHRIRFNVDDDGSSLECVFCGTDIGIGSDDVIAVAVQRMHDSGIEFEINLETNRLSDTGGE